MLAAACRGESIRTAAEGGTPLPAARGAALVVGSSLERWNLLAVPTDGGRASLRALDNPDHILWESGTALPEATAAVSTDDGVTALQQADGTVYRYDPRADELIRIGAVRPGGSWKAGGGHLLYVGTADSTLLQISREGNWRYKIGHPIEWATVVEAGGVAVLVRTPQHTELWLLRRGESEPAARAELSLEAPGVSTAWGRRVALGGAAEDEPAVQFVAIPELTPAGSEKLDGRVVALAASPSSHEVYAAVEGGDRLLAVNRINGSVRRLARLDEPAEEIRPALLGSYLLVRTGSSTHVVSLDGGRTEVPTDWSAGLPLGLPDGRILVVRDGRTGLFDRDSGEEKEVAGAPGSASWALVEWDPAPPPVVAGPVPGVPLRDSLAVSEAPLGAVSQGLDEATELVPAGGRDPAAGPEAAGAAPTERLLGFYAIVASARSYAGVVALTQSLGAAGYPTAVQTHRDDAGVVWYRGLVGPYSNRQGADAAARQLRRERNLQVWVTEFGTTFAAEEQLN